VQEQSANPSPTSISSIATAVPLATATPQVTNVPQTDVPATVPIVTVIITTTPPPSTEVPPPTAPPTCVISAKFIIDVTIPDGTIFVPNAVFTKTWRVQNNGTCVWDNYSLVFASGTQMATNGVYPVPQTQPGATADLVVPMTSPAAYGFYTGNWRMRGSAGQLFGPTLSVVINVPAPATAVPPSNTPPPTVAGCSGQPNDFTFTASSTAITAGQSTTLSWSAVTNASEARLDGGEFSNEGIITPGNRVVSPNATTDYTLTAKCNNSGQTRQKTVTITVNAAAGNFAGQWVHNFGTMTLTQNGNTVTGTYHNDFDGGNGVIAGIVSGNVLSGTYTKNQTLPIEFTLSGDGKRFNGNWNGTNTWCGARPGQNFPNGCSFQGNWNTKYSGTTLCDMQLTRKDNAVTGTYCNGTITGNITYGSSQTILTGNWKISNSNQGTIQFFLAGYNGLQFTGNWNGTQSWCGWRNSSSEPNPCLAP
jgi:hypothetical protein